MHRICSLLIIWMLLPAWYACSKPVNMEAGISYRLAQKRAGLYSNVMYELSFRIPDSLAAPIHGREVLSFDLARRGEPLILDFQTSRNHIRRVAIKGQTVPYEWRNGHLVIDAAYLAPGRNEVTIEFIAGESSLNRNADYLYTLFVPDRASRAFPCFDQPDIKARFRLQLDIPASWVAVANGPAISDKKQGTRRLVSFAVTKPISTYLFAFVAGKFRVEKAVRGGRVMRMYHRETDSGKVKRNKKEIFKLHEKALAFLETYTGIPYPFQKFDFVLIPSFQYGGMEHPGAILYRAANLLLEESATKSQLLGRASVIAHETAHMWFGDLVTMAWFNDVWMKEVFANFMAAKIVHPSFPELNHELRFLLAHHPAAYEVDRTAGANPIRQDLDNLKHAGTLYGAIIYRKAPVVMKHLELLMGRDAFQQGIRTYLRRYQFANAGWPDLIEILDRQTELNLQRWSRVWVEEAGRPAVRIQTEYQPDGKIKRVELIQQDPLNRGRIWPQWLNVVYFRRGVATFYPVYLSSSSAEVPELVGRPRPDFLLPAGKGLGYGLFLPDDASLSFLLAHLDAVEDELLRGVIWLTLWDAMLEGRVDPPVLFQAGLNHLPAEKDELIVSRMLADLRTIYWKFFDVALRQQWAVSLEEMLWRLLHVTDSPTLKASLFSTFRSIAITNDGVKKLRQIWLGRLTLPDLRLSERDHTALAAELALRQVKGYEGILQTQLRRIKNADRRERLRFVLPALSADPEERRAFFAALKEEKNRQHEPWVLEAMRYLQHPLRVQQPDSPRIDMILPALELVEEIQRTGDIFFPKRWLDATFSGHNSPEAAEVVVRFLQTRPDYPPRLKGKILQAADYLFRAARLLYGWNYPALKTE